MWTSKLFGTKRNTKKSRGWFGKKENKATATTGPAARATGRAAIAVGNLKSAGHANPGVARRIRVERQQ